LTSQQRRLLQEAFSPSASATEDSSQAEKSEARRYASQPHDSSTSTPRSHPASRSEDEPTKNKTSKQDEHKKGLFGKLKDAFTGTHSDK
jgi:hypothetical protein